MPKALISGLTGQDGSYLAELLLDKGYEVHGIVRRVANKDYCNIEHIIAKLKLHSATLESYASLYNVINEVKPDEFYHLAAQTFVKDSFEDEFSTMAININGTHYVFNAIKEIIPTCKIYYAGSSEMYGNILITPQEEFTPFRPVSPYGISKLAGYYLAQFYNHAFNMFIACGILFNHESPRRGKEFVTRKITEAAKRKEKVALGNLEARRDWGFAGDYVKAMWLMLQQREPEDFVIATGETHSVREFAELAYKLVGLDYKDYVITDSKFYRPNELNVLQGDYTKALTLLDWQPQVRFEELVRMMIEDKQLMERS